MIRVRKGRHVDMDGKTLPPLCTETGKSTHVSDLESMTKLDYFPLSLFILSKETNFFFKITSNVFWLENVTNSLNVK